jgi:hypothetical protein
MRRGCLWTIGIILGIGVAGWIYLTLNPPFALPETGYLSQEKTHDVSLTADAPAAAFRIRVSPSAGMYAGASAQFEPLRIQAALLADGVVDPGLGLRVYPLDGQPIGAMEGADERRAATWHMDCDEPEPEQPCPREFLAVIGGTPATQPTDLRLQLFAEQPFPPHVPTPFMVSISIDVTAVELPDATELLTTDATGPLQLSADSPVAVVPLQAAAGDAALGGGTLLLVDVERTGYPIPAGLRAPPPVRVAVLDPGGRIVGEMAPRPGERGAIGLPPMAGAYRLVAWWQDRADERYAVTWSLEQTRLGTGEPPTLTSGPATSPSPVREQLVEGSQVATPGSNGPSVQLLAETDVGVAGQGHLPQLIGILRVRFTPERDDEQDEAVFLQLAPSGGYDQERVPVPAPLGEEVETALGLPNCSASRCGGWNLLLEGPDNQPVRITWQGVLHLWPLDPDAGGAL